MSKPQSEGVGDYISFKIFQPMFSTTPKFPFYELNCPFFFSSQTLEEFLNDSLIHSTKNFLSTPL